MASINTDSPRLIDYQRRCFDNTPIYPQVKEEIKYYGAYNKDRPYSISTADNIFMHSLETYLRVCIKEVWYLTKCSSVIQGDKTSANIDIETVMKEQHLKRFHQQVYIAGFLKEPINGSLPDPNQEDEANRLYTLGLL